MTIQQLYYAITVSENGSMNRAAEKLYISQPTLTNAIKELEQELGITIFTRTGRGVVLTNEGSEFLLYARQVYDQYSILIKKYTQEGKIKKKFGVSTQHYSFAVKAFVETVKQYGTSKYDFAIRETRTLDVIRDVALDRSEVGILYRSNFNKKTIMQLLSDNKLEFHPLLACQAYVYIWKNHPLAGRKSIRFEELQNYPCLSFEQGDEGSFQLAEEILSDWDYPRTIKACDRATILNLMVGLNGYTLCSGIICEELNGSDYIAVPFEEDEDNPNSVMEFGYITKKKAELSDIGETFIREVKEYLSNQRV